MKKVNLLRIVSLLIAFAVIASSVLPELTAAAESTTPSDVKAIKPVITVERTAKKKAVIICTNSDGYGMKVYRATKKSGKYKLIKTTKKSKFTDKSLSANKVYYYKVKLYAKIDGKVYKSKASKIKKAKKYVKPLVERPVIVSVEQVGSGSGKARFVRISWKRYSSYKDSNVSFYVCRKEAGAENFMLIEGEIVWDDGVIYLTDNSAKSGKTYLYMVYAGSRTQDYTTETLEPAEYTVP